jgi:WD40 repeat protein
VWDLEKKREMLTIQGPASMYIAVAFRPDGRTLAAARTYVNKIQLVEMASGKERTEVNVRFPVCLAFSPDGRTLAAGSLDSTITLWDMTPAKRASK